jgi:hypothetical protein
MSGPGNRKRRKGATLVEATLVLSLFLAMLFGLFDISYGLFLRHSLMHSGRVALRWGVVRAYDPTAITNKFLYGTPDPAPGATGLFGLTPANVAVQQLEPGTQRARLVLTVSNFKYHVFAPGFAGIATGLPIVLSQPMEP